MGDDSRRSWLALGALLLVASAIVAGAFVPAPHNGGDNAAYVTLAYSLLADGSYTDLYDPAAMPHTKYPPVFPGLLALLVLLGARTWTALKIVAALSAVAGVGFTFLWSERRWGTATGFVVALGVALSSGVVYYSHWVLSDTLFLALTVAALWLFERSEEESSGPGWLVAGVIVAGLAYFTRSAGLPLLVAVFAWLALARRWKALAGTAMGLGLPVLTWWWRGRGAGVAEYGAEFWLVDPYQPELGRVGFAGLAGRVVTNFGGYLTLHLPGGIVGGGGGGFVALVGIGLTALALVGWFRSARARMGVAELFLPAYAGLILLWPEVWSGDRFALPLIPLFLGFGAAALQHFSGRLGGQAARAVLVLAALIIVVPSGRSWTRSVGEAMSCTAATRVGGAWACYGPAVTRFADAAGWAGEALPEGSAVMTRKPRIFYVLSGVPSRTFPFVSETGEQFRIADEVGARYLLFDEWFSQSGRFLGAALTQQPGAFCTVRGFGQTQGVGTHLFGLLPAERRGVPDGDGGNEVRVAGCPEGYVLPGAPADYSSSSSTRIPLLDRLDP